MFHKIPNLRIFFALSFIAVMSIYPVLTLPVMIGILMDHAGMSSFSAGWLTAIGTLSTASAGLIMSIKMDNKNLQKLSRFTLIIAIVTDLLSAFTAGATIIFFLVRVIWGLAMGVAHASSVSSIAHYDNFNQGYGIYVGLQFIVSGIGLYIIPVYADIIGVTGFFIGFAVLDFIALIFTKYLGSDYNQPDKINKNNTSLGVMISVPAILAIVGFTVFEAANTAQFSYIERFGVISNLSEHQIGVALLVGSVLGIPGAFSIFILGDKFGLVRPLVFGFLLSISALTMLLLSSNYTIYFITSCMLGFSWSFCMPFIESLLAKIDRKGRVVAAGSSISFFGSAFGPGMAAIVVSGDIYRNSFILSICLFFITLMIFMILGKKIKELS
jgi:MFS family permease